MADEVVKHTEIKFDIGLDENHIPIDMKWTASDGEGSGSCKALMVAIWDEKEDNTMRIDLWDREMNVYDMKKFFHQTLLTMADTFQRATNEEKISKEMKDFATYFAKEMELIS